MKEATTIVTAVEEYTDKYTGDFLSHYQVHIFSVPFTISTYYNPEFVSIEQVKHIADNLLTNIRKRSDRKNKITLFQKNGKFLISEDEELIDAGDLLFFDADNMRYEQSDVFDDLEYFLKEQNAEEFFKNALITIGAEDLYSEIQPFVKKIHENQIRICNDYEKWRELNETAPKLILEIYKIEKNYIPVKTKEFLCNSYESAMFLPEHRTEIDSNNRTTYLLREIASNKIIDGNLNEAIESIKYNKWFKKHPSVMDPDALRRMELDDDDPDALSMDEYLKNDDEYEEGDDEYSPR